MNLHQIEKRLTTQQGWIVVWRWDGEDGRGNVVLRHPAHPGCVIHLDEVINLVSRHSEEVKEC